MNNYKSSGDVLTLTAPYALSSGEPFAVDGILAVAADDAESGAAVEGKTCGEFRDMPKTTGAAWTVGEKLYWKVGTKKFSTVGADGQLAGVATEAAGSSDATGSVKLNGTASSMLEGAEAAVADLVDSSGGATADGTIGAVTAPTALTDNGAGTADGTVEAMAAVSTAGGNTYADAAVNAVFSAIRNNFKEFTATQTVNRAAVIALTDAVKELSTKQNALLAALRLNGILLP